MRYDPHALAEPADDLRYAANKLHGDEIVTAGGAAFRELKPAEWLGRGEVEELIGRTPGVELLLVDDTVDMPKVCRVPGPARKAWRQRLSALCSSDDGEFDPQVGWGLMAYRWATSGGREALVFRFEC
ncbi:hypothetical protein Kfla_0282 [Kribbella flavida DSM 17836]|uniref:Uncharacterized protein n=1 Tax=Kribbella flavida (strain DSM 17836 / JCM 10339 / NBRC 14399) TaxID=479435 RepID=D2PT90_KRIFD|nr:hypothetical protein [Kribbella flavida]ADB29406.1 hypothetical protein Kfla_0282 [Kribbella flavida DSM 17836]